VEIDNYCFCCGADNPHGLKLAIESGDDGEVFTYFTPPDYFQGFHGVVHGGILSTLMDEIMAHAALRGVPYNAATARMEVSFRRPALTGVQLKIIGRIKSVTGRRITTEAEILNPDKKKIAEATGLFLRLRDA